MLFGFGEEISKLCALGLGRLEMSAEGFVWLAHRKLLDRGNGAIEGEQLNGVSMFAVA